MRKLKASNEADLKKALEVTKTALNEIGEGITRFLADHERLKTVIGAIVVTSAGYFTVRQVTIFLKTVSATCPMCPQVIGVSKLSLLSFKRRWKNLSTQSPP